MSRATLCLVLFWHLESGNTASCSSQPQTPLPSECRSANRVGIMDLRGAAKPLLCMKAAERLQNIYVIFSFDVPLSIMMGIF